MGYSWSLCSNIPAALNNKFQIPKKPAWQVFLFSPIQAYFDALRRALTGRLPAEKSAYPTSFPGVAAPDCSTPDVYAPV